jgi:hypothetical protein
MKILVCVKQVPERESRFRLDPSGKGYSDQGINFVLNPAMSLMPLLVTQHFGGGAFQLGWLESALRGRWSSTLREQAPSFQESVLMVLALSP